MRGIFLLLLAFFCGLATSAPAEPSRAFERIEAVRADASSDTPPVEGWMPLTLPDNTWPVRWPGYDGVVWYRLRWSEATGAALPPVGLALDHFSMAGAVYLNGALLDSDENLQEPLSRSWNRPRYWVLNAPLLRPGSNELLVRVSGMAAYHPGLGLATLGTPALARAHFERERLVRQSLHLVSLGFTVGMGLLYGLFWLLRRRDTFYGWFSLFSLLWVPVGYNYVAISAWPLGSTHAFQAIVQTAQLLSIPCFLMFVLLVCDLKKSRAARLAWAAAGLGTAALWLAPLSLQTQIRQAVVVLELVIFCFCVWLVCRQALVSGKREVQALALCTLLPLVAGLNDVAVFVGWLNTNMYYTPWSASSMMVGISFVLTWRFVVGMRLVEHFNVELQVRVEEATERMSSMLRHEHAVELMTTRLAERTNLVRDLHDGLGMTLSGHIASLESGHEISEIEALWALKEVRDDLRLIIENSTLDQNSDRLSQRVTALRHRTTRVLEAAGIECIWTLQLPDDCRLSERRCLDFLRLLQEALANVLKHSQASQVRVDMEVAGGRLLLTVRDNGRGFSLGESESGMHKGLGMRSMAARARRLNGELDVRSSAHGTAVVLDCPIE
ncbi:7TM diverse intracellular signaling domain-containing protein [Variovorax sp. GB1P17]|uniref:sensor histidine kinase n=1 Tax=Variovorax sp. GB1P17 TaxID=3443740 RepID=UPI003F483F0B